MGEHGHLENGCSAHADCFSCPFLDCIAGQNFAVGGDGRPVIKANRRERVLAAARVGRPVRDVAEEFGMTEKAVRKVLDGG